MSLNKQGESGINWCDFSWNPIQGCFHDCRWEMPGGKKAQCYAKTFAEKNRSRSFMEKGFEHHYWHPERLDEPQRFKVPSKIFLDSFSDLMGAWVPTEQIQAVLDACAAAPWHRFQLLTKNAPRLLKFTFPQNVWVGVSVPPSAMLGKALNIAQQSQMLTRTLEILPHIRVPVRWLSIEPLSFDVAPLLKGAHLEWAVIGAATRGTETYQPESAWVENALAALDSIGARVCFKNNLTWSPTRNDMPADLPVPLPNQLSMF